MQIQSESWQVQVQPFLVEEAVDGGGDLCVSLVMGEELGYPVQWRGSWLAVVV